MTPSKKGLLYFVLGAAVAAGLAVLLTRVQAPLVGAVVFGVATIAAVIEHLVTARRMARTPTRWDPPTDAGWQVLEHTLHATSVVEVGDASDAAETWLLFRTSPEACFVVAKSELCVEKLAPVKSLDVVAQARVELRRLSPGGRMLPLAASGAMIPARAFSREEGTWSPQRSLDPEAPELPVARLPEWLGAALV